MPTIVLHWSSLLPCELALAALIGVLLDRLLGEPQRWHPLVGFGRLADFVERTLRGNAAPGHPLLTRFSGLLGWMLLVLPAFLLACWAVINFPAPMFLHVLLLCFALGAQSLKEHAEAVLTPLLANDLPAARNAIGRIVSRDTTALDATGISRATVETVLENGNDAVFATLFWFALLGGPGALLFRLANTLDAMWGYRTDRLRYFGWAAARLDDVLNYIPARLTALTYAVLGHTSTAFQCWRSQAAAWDSPNAGPVMAAGAGALQVQLGGAAKYHGHVEERPTLGLGEPPGAQDISRALQLVQRGVWVWLLALAILEYGLA